MSEEKKEEGLPITVTTKEALEITIQLFRICQQQKEILEYAVKAELKRTGGTVPILSEALKRVQALDISNQGESSGI